MNLSTWRPHGLVRTPELEFYYREAKAAVVDNRGNTSRETEDKSVRLFAQLLAKYVFPGANYAVVPGPTPYILGQDSSCLVVECCTPAMAFQALCFVEIKKPENAAARLRVTYLEEQARAHCTEFLRRNPSLKRAYACTVVAARVRCFMVAPDHGRLRMTGLWSPRSELGTFEHYRDVGLDENRVTLERAFDQMKNYPPSRSH